MERGRAANVPETIWRYLAVDEQGTGLRATWRPGHGFTNLSLWQGDVCVETFHLSPAQMGELVAFLGTSLAGACPPQARLRIVPPTERAIRTGTTMRVAVRKGREACARVLGEMAAWVHPTRSK